ncbi:DNA topoisomerase IV [Gangjinia marincola]
MSSCYQAERNCEAFKTGTFEFTTYLEGEMQTTVFKRTDSLSIETFKGKSDTASIRWINPCEFILTDLTPKNSAEEKPLHFKILTTSNSQYTFEYALVGATNKQRGTATKVK